MSRKNPIDRKWVKEALAAVEELPKTHPLHRAATRFLKWNGLVFSEGTARQIEERDAAIVYLREEWAKYRLVWKEELAKVAKGPAKPAARAKGSTTLPTVYLVCADDDRVLAIFRFEKDANDFLGMCRGAQYVEMRKVWIGQPPIEGVNE